MAGQVVRMHVPAGTERQLAAVRRQLAAVSRELVRLANTVAVVNTAAAYERK
jgi:hypothetical protein